MKNVILYIEKSKETFTEALVMFDNNLYSGCVSRAYYSSFYAIQATLASKKIDTKTHMGALSMFNLHFIKEEIFPKHISKFVKETLDKRLLSDYEIGFKATQGDAEIAIEYAKEIIETISKYLNIPKRIK